MGFMKPVKWLGRLFQSQRSTSAKAGPSESSPVQATSIAAFPPASHKALRRLVSHSSLQECRQTRQARQGVTKTTAFSVQHQPASSQHRAKGCSHRRKTSVDLQQYTHSLAAGREPYSEDIANRNIIANESFKDGPSSNPLWRPEDVYLTYATYDPRVLRKRIVAKAQALQKQPTQSRSSLERKQPRDADARPWSPRSSRSVFSGESNRRPSKCSEVSAEGRGPDAIHARIISLPTRLRSLSHKQSIPDLRLARELGHKRSQTFPGADPPIRITRPPITRADLNKPLPPLPNTEDTTVHTTWAPAVTHHTIRRDMHEIHQDQVTHEFHQDEYEHRVLPVMDYEILPARHFVQLDGGGLEEIPEEDVPNDLPQDLQQRISEAAATLFPHFRDSGVSFGSGDGTADPVQSSHRDSITPEGHVRRDTTWTYPTTFLPSRYGSEHFHHLFVHLDGADAGVGRTHVRSFSDGPPVIPPRGVRQVDVLSVASAA